MSNAFTTRRRANERPTRTVRTMRKSTKTTITLVTLTALAACATPAEGKFTSVKKYRETHSREEFVNLLATKNGKKRERGSRREAQRPDSEANASPTASGERGRSLTAYAYCEGHHNGQDWNQHCAGRYYDYLSGTERWEWCETGYTDHTASNGEKYTPGKCVRNCGSDEDCPSGTFCGYASYNGEERQCLPCSHSNDDFYSYNSCRSCSSDSDCPGSTSSSEPTYCATSIYDPSVGRCSTCHDCYSYNVFSGSSCPSQCTNLFTSYAAQHNFRSTDIRGDEESLSLSNLPSDCWHEAVANDYGELHVGDCGAFGEETELWCDGFCLSDSWFDCCDPKAGAIAALTMGCFFAAVGALFTAAWIFKCWCFKKPNALMLQAMANQQQQRAMAAGQMQSPVVVQMQAAAPARK